MTAIDSLQALTSKTFETNFCDIFKTEEGIEIECTISRAGVMLEILDPTGKTDMRVSREEYIQLYNWINLSERSLEEVKKFINDLLLISLKPGIELGYIES